MKTSRSVRPYLLVAQVVVVTILTVGGLGVVAVLTGAGSPARSRRPRQPAPGDAA